MRTSLSKFYISFFALVFLFCSLANATPKKIQKGEEAWRSLKKAQDAFEAKDFGTAIKFADQAKEIRKRDAEWQSYVLEGTLRKQSIRQAGDSIDNVIPVLKELGLSDALNIVDSHIEKLSSEYFGGSYSKIIDFISFYAQYPEADHLLGKIYRLEGEYGVSFSYMKNALDYSINLDVPMEKYDLLYDLAYLSIDTGNEDDYEKYLLLIVSDSDSFMDEGYMKALLRLVDANESDSMEKFFLLYRCENAVALKAFIDLSRFYAEKNENKKALRFSAFASIIAVTRIESVIRQRIQGFEYEGFGSLISLVAEYDDICEWGNENRVWELFCDFSDVAAIFGKDIFASSIFTALSESLPEGYWKNYTLGKKKTSSISESESTRTEDLVQ